MTDNAPRFWRRSLKALHEIGALGLGGGFAACLVINLKARSATPEAFIAGREAFTAIADYLLFPSLGLVILSGLLSIAATRAFHDAGWAWVKGLLGISLFEATLMTIGAGRRQAELAASVADPALMNQLLQAERNTLLALAAICIVNVVLAVWRPSLMVKIR
ncbi:hypothetical protein [Nevskia sp.]|uniref:hypothetical protein n=1 Tax=Nevskia sp. TaxID=1929292 RepID=UPI003F6E607C